MDSLISKNDKSVLQMILNPNLPFTEQEDNIDSVEDPDAHFDAVKVEKVKELEREGVKLAENKKIVESLSCFDEAIQILPERASAYNNRAQTKRFNNDIDGALEDLNRAILLGNNRGKVVGLAFAQRSIIMKLKGDDEESTKDLKRAAELGNKFAKQELVQRNPYAALCNQMLSQVIGELQGKSDES
ncbi:tetratricopeptide repeat protein 36-like [Clavelina lepadiformis]|uniref:Tetratricopeptide repeat protein 36 n=1 Tax=Clavelina lepadiformis TaxID=159417 RepID=A0ABP0FRN0_CLALP